MSEGGLNGLDLDVEDLTPPAPTYEGGPNRSTGRPPKPLPEPLDVAELSPEDVEALRESGPAVGGTGTRLQKIRGSHHFIARAHVAGIKNNEISRLIGYSPSTISALLSQPAMKDLIVDYAEKLTEATFDYVGRLKALGMMSLDVLEEAFEMDSDVSPEFALKVAQFTSDRIGHGPASTVNGAQKHEHVHFTGDQLVELREKMRERRLIQGGPLGLIDPAERRQQEAQAQIEMEERSLSLPEGAKEISPADHGVQVPREGSAPTTEALGDKVSGGSVREESGSESLEYLPGPGGDL